MHFIYIDDDWMISKFNYQNLVSINFDAFLQLCETCQQKNLPSTNYSGWTNSLCELLLSNVIDT